MNHLDRLNISPRFRTGLASLALLGAALLGNAQPLHAAGGNLSCGGRPTPFFWRLACKPNAQTAEIHALLVAVHEVTSYNGDEQTAIDHLEAWEQLWAEDATLVVNGGEPKVGRDAIIDFFAGGALFTSNLIGLTPSFRTQVAIHGNTAQVYLECIFVNESKQIVAERALSGTVRKVGGKWLFWKMANDQAQSLF